MKKLTALCLVLCLALVLAACGAAPASSAATGSAGSLGAAASGAEGTVTLKVGASPSPHAEILEHAAELLAAEGITLDIVEFDDYVMPNTALQEGSLDAPTLCLPGPSITSRWACMRANLTILPMCRTAR